MLKENKQLEIDNYNLDANLQRMSDMLDEAKRIIKDLLGSESHCCTEDEFFEIREKANRFIAGAKEIQKENAITERIIIGEQMEFDRLEKEKCELLGIIQKKDELIKKMKCCMVCSHYDFSTPNYCHKGIYRANQIVCEEWELEE